MRRLFLLNILFISISLMAQNFDNLNFGTDSTIDIISWNVENFPKNGNTTINDLSQAIEALDADIFAFQEIANTDDFISIINGMPQYDYYIGDWYYTALVFIYKPAIIKNVDLYEIYTSSAYWSPFPRSPLVIEFSCMGQNYAVINNHLKCCGDGNLEMDNQNDEEFRRYSACNYLKIFIEDTMDNLPVVVLGDMNDELDDNTSDNVFQLFINDASNYRFDDMEIATGSSSNWSYPSYPSHLDHILITNELFDMADHPASGTEVIKVDDVFSSFYAYDNDLSDHRPVGIKLYPGSGLDVEKKVIPEFKVFPNPVHNELHINGSAGIIKLKIFSPDGRLILSEEPAQDNLSIDISGLQPGSYILQLETECGISTKQIIKW